jgi:hypothetical protein
VRHIYSLQVAFDSQGDALVAWNSEYGIQVAGYVAHGPTLNDVKIPAEGPVGQLLSFSVSPLDIWSMLGETNWSFGDGNTANGTNVNHTYAAAGTYEVTLHSADLLGNVTSTSANVTVTSPPSSLINAPHLSTQTSNPYAVTPLIPPKPVVRCIVPRLRGKSLSLARRALKNAHCMLGKVIRPLHRRGVLIVVAQGARAGQKLGESAPVTIRLGSPRSR